MRAMEPVVRHAKKIVIDLQALVVYINPHDLSQDSTVKEDELCTS